MTITLAPIAEKHTDPDTARSFAAEADDVTLTYGENVVLSGTTLRVAEGEIVALIGRSGCGKSTLLRLLAGLASPSAGTVRTSGAPAVAFQEPRLFPWRTVRQNVAHGLIRTKARRAEAAERAETTLAEVGLADKSSVWPGQLSGGQAQRVSLARALVGDPELLLLDEPFGALDALTRATMHRLLLSLWRRHGFGVLVVTHDVDEALVLADRVAVLADGRIVHQVQVPRPRGGVGSGPSEPSAEQHACLRDELLEALDEA